MVIPLGVLKKEGLVILVGAPRKDGHFLGRVEGGWSGHSLGHA